MNLVPCYAWQPYESVVRERLPDVIEHSPRPLDPEMVFDGLRLGIYLLWLGFDEAGECQGFLLTERVEDVEPRLNIVAAQGKLALPSWENGMWQAVEAHARSLGCSSVEFLANRPGWERHAERIGFHEKLRVYSRAVIS